MRFEEIRDALVGTSIMPAEPLRGERDATRQTKRDPLAQTRPIRSAAQA